ncbi:MAG: TIGR04282 family arsenosugar biosynthesis glycosyltransferase [Gammaproteobacteria bacterium]
MSRVQRPDVLAVFVKAPLVGQVKTRLAADIGAPRATELYRALGRSVVSACIGPSHETVVWFSPVEARPIVREWLGDLAIADYRAQPTGSLGSRLIAALRDHFHEGARRVVLIGSDCPGIHARLVSRAFAFLDEHDLVIGPARDGGYYLIGLRGPAPQLFRGISWSTATVLQQTLTRARRVGLRPAILPTLRDIDTADDARVLGLLPSR